MTTNFKIKGVYNFDVYPSAILGTSFKNVTVMAIMDRATANKEIDTQAMHVLMYPYLPSGSVNDPDGYDYIKIKTTTGQTTIIGISWINDDTVELVESRTVTVVIDGVTASDVNRIKNALVQNGYSALTISIK